MRDRPVQAAFSGDAEVQAWVVGLDRDTDEIRRCAALLSSEERSRAARFRFIRDRDRYIAGRATLRRLLAGYLGAGPATIDIRPNPFGKPELRGPFAASPLRFNVSHSGALAVYVFTVEGDIGVDLEARRPIAEAELLAGRFFSPHEAAVLRALSPSARADAFLNGWTRKEAFLKARGDGLRFRLDRFDVALAPGEPARLLAVDGDPAAAREWAMAELPVAPDHVAAVVVRGRIGRIFCRPGRPPARADAERIEGAEEPSPMAEGTLDHGRDAGACGVDLELVSRPDRSSLP
jgi:4'-phosphopantetheinyl transferase